MTNAIDTVKVGRVFFTPDSGPNVESVTVLTLDSHVGNVVDLVKKFQRDSYPTLKRGTTRNQLIRAAQKHDDAKPETFRITYRSWKGDGPKSLGYSFAGHRFRVSDSDPYVELLIRLHHEFSVEGIVKAQFQLSNLGFSKAEVESFPLDLYILEMCDQIEAEIETYAFTSNVQPRVFMEFHSGMREDGKLEVNPYPFGNEEISLSLAYYQLEIKEIIPEKEYMQLVKGLESDNPQESQLRLRDALVDAPKYVECQQKEVILCKAH